MRKLFFLMAALLASCASLTENVQLRTEGKPEARLLIYREPAYVNSAMDLYFGENGKYFLTLQNGYYTEIKIDAGKHVFLAGSSATSSNSLEIELVAGQLNCIKASLNSAALGSVLIPILGNAVGAFTMEKVECPTSDFLKKYHTYDKA
jgi:hypothetical protein